MFGLSSTQASTTNQQVGAEGNQGPVFGAITIKGNKSASTKTKTSSGGSGGHSAESMALNPSAGNGTPGNVTSSTGNLNISVVSSDVNADNNLASIAGESILAQNNLANNSMVAQNNLALSALGTASQLASASLGLAEQSESQSQNNAMQLASMSNASANSIEQAGENFAALNDGADPNGVVAPISQDNGKLTNILIVASIAVTVLLLFKK